MNTLTKFVCIMFAGAAALPALAAAQDPQAAISRVEVRHYLPLTTACPGVVAQLVENLYPAWRAIDSAAVVLVDFKLEGGKASEVTMSGGHGDYVQPIRHAVKAMACSHPDEGTYAVRFRINFVYPEDQGKTVSAMQISDATPALAALQVGTGAGR